ncbi:MAG: glycosyltransferase, partial [Clostridia bacterium]|nr:glycosyltransferase [Clostridia bacterium]
TVGRISEEKGFDMLSEIAKRVFARCPDWEWHIMGDGPDREKLEAKIAEYALEKNIVMHGMVKNASESFGEYSIMALTSYREGLPLILLEAKAKKLPCVSFDVVTGPAEIIRDGVNGYLIPPYDCDAFADKLCALAESEELRQDFSDNALLDVDKFKKEKILKLWFELIEKLTK